MSEDAQLKPEDSSRSLPERSGIRFRSMTPSVHTVSGDFDPTMHELRVVTCDVVRHAEDTLPLVERAVPDVREQPACRVQTSSARCGARRTISCGGRSRAAGRVSGWRCVSPDGSGL